MSGNRSYLLVVQENTYIGDLAERAARFLLPGGNGSIPAGVMTLVKNNGMPMPRDFVFGPFGLALLDEMKELTLVVRPLACCRKGSRFDPSMLMSGHANTAANAAAAVPV